MTEQDNILEQLQKKLDELQYANIFNSTVKGSTWFDHSLSLSPGRSAVGYNFLYVLYRILDSFHPKNILELGLGQSTKLLSKYIHAFKTDNKIKHYVVEHDTQWKDFFCHTTQFSQETKITLLPLEKVAVALPEYHIIYTYKNFQHTFIQENFDLIIVDGPFGSTPISRIDILDILPSCLEKDFIILIDDAQRIGEKKLIDLILFILNKYNISYSFGRYYGEDDVCVITSDKLKFFCSL